jgi:hypothetical protein
VSLIVSIWLGATTTRADMVLSEAIVDLQSPGEMRHDIEVSNSGEEPLYVEIEVAQIVDPERAQPTRVHLDDPRTAGLLASPNRLVVAPAELKRVRVVVRKPATERDLVYRVSFIPRENPAVSEEEIAFKVLIGYDVLVIVRPPQGKPELRVEREGQRMLFENAGNSSVLIRKLEQCPEAAAECTEINGNRLYAGERWEVILPHPEPVRVFESYRSNNTVKQY